MTLHTCFISLFIFGFICPFKCLVNNLHSSGLILVDYVSKNTTSFLPIDNSTAREEVLSELQEVLSNMTETPILTNSGSTSRVERFRPDVYPRDLGDFKITPFDEKKREDAFEKKPAAESPHAVMLLIFYDEDNDHPAPCSGSLLTLDWVLTASHCLVPLSKEHKISKLLVYAGGYSQEEVLTKNLAVGSQLRIVNSILPHPKYNYIGDAYDFGLVRVSIGFNASDTVKPIGISTQPWDHQGFRKCQLTGFGIVQIGKKSPDDQVRKTHMLDVKKPCLCMFQLGIIFGKNATASFLCTRPVQDHGPCQGDSGGGLVCNGKVAGVVVAGVTLQELNNCTDNKLPVLKTLQCGTTDTLGIFIDSFPFLPWVNSHVRLFNDSQISKKFVVRSTASRTLQEPGLWLILVAFTAISHLYKNVKNK